MSGYSIQALRRLPLAALVLALPLLVSGCDHGDSTGSPLPAAKNVKASSSSLTAFDLTGHAFDPFDATGAKAIVQGKPVPYSTAKAVGCYIPEPK